MASAPHRVIRIFLTRQFAGFVAVGVAAALLHWLSRIVLSLWIAFPAAVALAYGVGLATAFALNRAFVFPNSTRPIGEQARGFVIVNVAFFPVVWTIAVVVNGWVLPALGVPRFREEIAHAIAIAMPMLATFLIYKYSTFRGG